MACFLRAVRVSTVRYDSGPNTLIQLAFPPPTVALLNRHGVCQKLAIDDKARQVKHNFCAQPKRYDQEQIIDL